MAKVRVNSEYYYNPVGVDIWDARTDLKVGDKVLVIFAEEGGAAVAKKIGPAKAAAAKKDPAEKKEKKEQAAE
jgi:hypothetical protein